WTYSTAEELGGSSHWGRWSTYGGGGYYEDLSLNRSKAIEKLQNLKNNDWITGRTSAIFLDLIVYNANVDAIFTVKLFIEYTLKEGLARSYYGNTVQLHQRVTAYHCFVAVCEWLFVAFFIFFIIKWIVICVVKDYRYVDPASHRVILRVDSAFEFLSLPILLCGYAVICFRIYGYVVIEPPIIQNISEEKLGNLDSSRLYEAFYVILSGLLLHSAWPKICRYTSFKHGSSLVKNWKEITAISVVIIFIFVTCLHIMNCGYCGFRFHSLHPRYYLSR
ncbi:polycystic kidney disease 2-like 1 protein, partial [Zootermopsis nevadensis]|uniref:polycystic kidney disease 2-like 1 protein n=1 Tax=Zootermopsis nevadensis TaxID=136037 RepID=UPI000B8EAA55